MDIYSFVLPLLFNLASRVLSYAHVIVKNEDNFYALFGKELFDANCSRRIVHFGSYILWPSIIPRWGFFELSNAHKV